MPDLKDKEPLCEAAARELRDCRLWIIESLYDKPNSYNYDPKRPKEEQIGYKARIGESAKTMHLQSPTLFRSWTTFLGDRLLEFVKSPKGIG